MNSSNSRDTETETILPCQMEQKAPDSQAYKSILPMNGDINQENEIESGETDFIIVVIHNCHLIKLKEMNVRAYITYTFIVS